MVSVFLYFVLVHSGTVLSSSFILPLFFFRLPLYHKKEALSEGHPELMQRIITENIPHREHKHIVQISRRCYAMIEVQSHFFLPRSHMIPHQSEYMLNLALCSTPQVRHETRGACVKAWFTVRQMTGIVEEGNWLVSM